MEKIYKKDINKLMPILQALVEGKTIQFATTDKEWVDLDGNKDGLSLETLINNPQSYRIKSKSEFRLLRIWKSAGMKCKSISQLGG